MNQHDSDEERAVYASHNPTRAPAQHTPGQQALAEVLAALKETERRLTYLIEREQHKMLDVVARDKARAAIAKATGSAK